MPWHVDRLQHGSAVAARILIILVRSDKPESPSPAVVTYDWDGKHAIGGPPENPRRVLHRARCHPEKSRPLHPDRRDRERSRNGLTDFRDLQPRLA